MKKILILCLLCLSGCSFQNSETAKIKNVSKINRIELNIDNGNVVFNEGEKFKVVYSNDVNIDYKGDNGRKLAISSKDNKATNIAITLPKDKYFYRLEGYLKKGSVTLNFVNADKYKFKTIQGNIKANLDVDLSKYQIKTKTMTGDSNIKNQVGSDPDNKKIKFHTTHGNIIINSKKGTKK